MRERRCGRAAWIAALMLAGLFLAIGAGTSAQPAAAPVAAADATALREAAMSATTAGPRYPFPQHRVYAPGTIRPTHRTPLQQDNDVRAAYRHWKATYLVRTGTVIDGTRLYRVALGQAGTPDRGVTVSEGQGYGMIIVALMAGYDVQAQTIFRGLWQFSRAHPSAIDARLMGWRVPPDAEGNDSAFDGDCDSAYALLLADKQWGSSGPIHYRAAARRVIAAILQSTIGPQSRLPMLGDWVDPGGARYNQYTPRSSDFMPGHFRVFRRVTGQTAWAEVVRQTQRVVSRLQQRSSPATGLLPDFIVPVSRTDHTPRPAPANYLEGPYDGRYYYNAGRDPWRLGTDALLNNSPVSLAQTRKISAWAQARTGGVPLKIRAGYTLGGAALPESDYFTTFFAAPLGVAAMTMPSQQRWLNAIYDAVRGRYEGYYEDTVTLLCLLVMTRNFWDPTTVDAPEGSARAFLPEEVR